MNLSLLEERHTKWRDILVIGKTIERDDGNCHIVGMTLSDEAKLYIIEPYTEPKQEKQKGVRNHRRMLKEQKEISCRYLHCSDFSFGGETLKVQGGMGGSLEYSTDDYGIIQLFLDMMGAGWTVPDWLKNTDWDKLQLVTLTIADRNALPAYSPHMPITITHRPDFARYILEKTITLTVGKSRSFSFTDKYGDNVQCYINNVMLIDVWKSTEEELNDPKLTEKFSPKQLAQARKHSLEALKQCCPKGMCYVGIEYECTKDYNLVFYAKQYLASRPETHQGSSHFIMMRLKPDQEMGTHGLLLKGCAIHTPLSPDTVRIPAELFMYHEKIKEWTETVL